MFNLDKFIGFNLVCTQDSIGYRVAGHKIIGPQMYDGHMCNVLVFKNGCKFVKPEDTPHEWLSMSEYPGVNTLLTNSKSPSDL